jgi:hypothetical protein
MRMAYLFRREEVYIKDNDLLKLARTRLWIIRMDRMHRLVVKCDEYLWETIKAYPIAFKAISYTQMTKENSNESD